MQEYFAIEKKENKFVLSKQDLFQISTVLRMRQNDHIVVTFEKEKYDCVVSFLRKEVEITIDHKLDVNNELDVEITLVYGLPKKDKFEMVVQKATELGVTKIVPFEAKRSVSLLNSDNVSKKLERWNMIAKEASEQSKRNIKVEVVNPVKLKEILNYKGELNIVPYEELNSEGTTTLYNLLDKKPGSDNDIDIDDVKFSNDLFDK